MELRLKKRCDGLFEATDNETVKHIDKIDVGHVINYIHIKKKNRNHKNLQRWQLFCKDSFTIQKTYDSLQVWKKILCIAAGHTDTVVSKNGHVQYLPNRMSYEECRDEELFKNLFKKAVSWFLKNHNKGMSDEKFLQMMRYQ